MTDSDNNRTVHVVEDNQRIADMYVKWLSAEYDTGVSYDGEDALSSIDDDVDVVLLDRDLPGINGDEVLKRLRNRSGDRIIVAMLTATNPSTDLVEMECDDYVRKPVPEAKLHDSVEKLLARTEYDEDVQQYLSLSQRAELLEDKFSVRKLAEDDHYQGLVEELEDLEGEIRAKLERRGIDTYEPADV